MKRSTRSLLRIFQFGSVLICLVFAQSKALAACARKGQHGSVANGNKMMLLISADSAQVPRVTYGKKSVKIVH